MKLYQDGMVEIDFSDKLGGWKGPTNLATFTLGSEMHVQAKTSNKKSL